MPGQDLIGIALVVVGILVHRDALGSRLPDALAGTTANEPKRRDDA
jgi:hypothetical protein